MWSQRPDGHRAHRVSGVLAAAGGGHVVRFIDDQKVVSPRVGRLIASWQRLAEGAQRPLTLEVVNGRNQPRKMRPWIDMDAALSSQIANSFTIDDTKFETKFVPHLLLPLYL